MRNFFLVLVLTSGVLGGCDRFFVVKGRVAGPPLTVQGYEFTGSISDPRLDPLPEARIALFYVRQGKTTELADRGSDGQGSYPFYTNGAPFGSLTKDLFLEFRKPGYKTQLVSVAGGSTDTGVQIKECTDEERSACWEVNVVLVQEAPPR